MDSRVQRIRTEAAIAAVTYTSQKKVEMDSYGGSWVIFRGFLLPPGYSQSRTDLMLKLPASYPRTAPDFFWTARGLRKADGKLPDHYIEHWDKFNDLHKIGWATCSLHIRSWRPHFDPSKGHNLSTVCQLAQEAFRRWLK